MSSAELRCALPIKQSKKVGGKKKMKKKRLESHKSFEWEEDDANGLEEPHERVFLFIIRASSTVKQKRGRKGESGNDVMNRLVIA